MPTLVWFNQPTNHSGTVHFLYLDPDAQVGRFTLYVADGGGPYILGGPALADARGELSEAALTLISLLPAAIHIFPPSSERAIRRTITQHRATINDESPELDPDDWGLQVYSKAYTTTQCCELLLHATQPESAIVFLDRGADGDTQLAVALAQIYYGLSKARREELKLGPDWNHHWES